MYVQNTDLIGLREFFWYRGGPVQRGEKVFLAKVNYYQGKMSTFGSHAPTHKTKE